MRTKQKLPGSRQAHGMALGRWVNVKEREDLGVFKQLERRDLSTNDLAKDARSVRRHRLSFGSLLDQRKTSKLTMSKFRHDLPLSVKFLCTAFGWFSFALDRSIGCRSSTWASKTGSLGARRQRAGRGKKGGGLLFLVPPGLFPCFSFLLPFERSLDLLERSRRRQREKRPEQERTCRVIDVVLGQQPWGRSSVPRR